MTEKPDTKTAKIAKPLASQTLFRGLDVVSAVAEGCRSVKDISDRTGIAFSTTHRLASALVQIRYLHFEPRKGYRLGSRLVELGFLAYRESAITTTARPLLEELAEQTQDTVHLAALDEDEGIIYLDKIGGKRPIEVNTRIGGRKPVCCTSVGKALILDQGRAAWTKRYEQEAAKGLAGPLSLEQWLEAWRSMPRRDTPLTWAKTSTGSVASARLCAMPAEKSSRPSA